jgi:ribosome-associated protein
VTSPRHHARVAPRAHTIAAYLRLRAGASRNCHYTVKNRTDHIPAIAKNKKLAPCTNCGYDTAQETFKLIQLRSEPTPGAQLPPATVTPSWLTALGAAESKKATSCRVLDLREVSTLADYFLICSATNQRQAQAIWDEIAKQMKEQLGEKAVSVEGYSNGEWIVGDFVDLIVHVFTPDKRAYYDLERLWRHAREAPLPS